MTNKDYQGERIVLIDDDPCYLWLIRMVAQSLEWGNDLFATETPAAVLAAEKMSRTPSLFVIDHWMQPTTGLELISQIREHGALQYTPIVLMSFEFTQSEVQRAYAAGANSCMTKPGELDAYKSTFTALFDYWLKLEARMG